MFQESQHAPVSRRTRRGGVPAKLRFSPENVKSGKALPSVIMKMSSNNLIRPQSAEITKSSSIKYLLKSGEFCQFDKHFEIMLRIVNDVQMIIGEGAAKQAVDENDDGEIKLTNIDTD